MGVLQEDLFQIEQIGLNIWEEKKLRIEQHILEYKKLIQKEIVMKEKKPQPRIELPLDNPKRSIRPLRNPLSADDLASKTYGEYKRKLDQKRLQEAEEEKGNASGQNKP